jgi:hypothetical protein
MSSAVPRPFRPAVVLEIAKKWAAARLMEGDTAKGRALLKAWRNIDPECPNMLEYTALVRELERMRKIS